MWTLHICASLFTKRKKGNKWLWSKREKLHSAEGWTDSELIPKSWNIKMSFFPHSIPMHLFNKLQKFSPTEFLQISACKMGHEVVWLSCHKPPHPTKYLGNHLNKEYLSNHWTDPSQISNLSLSDQTKLYACWKGRWPLMEDDLKILKMEYLCNHW